MDLEGRVDERGRELEHCVICVADTSRACLPACCSPCVTLCLNSHGTWFSKRPLSCLAPHQRQPVAILEGNAPVESGGGSAGATPAVPPLSASPWQSESLLAESWSTMGDVDPEDAKSLDSSDGGAAAENLSCNSDMVHLEEAEEEEEGEEDEELQSSVLDLQTAETEEALLMSSEEPQAQFTQMLPPMALPPLPVFRLEPPSTTSTPTPSTTAAEEPPYTSPGLLPPSSILSPAVARDVSSEEGSEVGGPADLPVLLCGGAALVAVVGVMAYGVVAYCRK
ncbi:bcl-2-like protein 13 [Hippocampus zosterae]|uniref:bcl-2-like protein 13 n=1 Tax=Hippocampus zosterae TaxID=109293 RepID=UPI00223D925D|nr:bcl-2-like protein 13 [Hippocampus zosterae]